MNLNPLPWLLGCLVRAELPKWTASGIIQPEQEQRIGDQYDKECCGLTVADCAKLTLFVLAAVAMLLALVLITIENWRSIHFALKVSLTLLLMAVAHGTGYWYRFQMDDARRGDTCFFLGTILYGATVSLVADHVGVPELYPWAFFAWAAGTLPLAWVLGSCSMLALANALATVWFVWHILVSGEAAYTSLFVAQGLCLIRWSYVNRSRGLFTFTLASLILWWCMLAVAEDLGRAGFFWVAGLGPVLVLIALRHDEQHPFTPIYKNLGVGLGVFVLLALALPSVSTDLMEIDPVGSVRALWFWLCAVAAAGVAIAFVPAPRRLDVRREWPPLAVLAGVTLLPTALSGISYAQGNSVVATIALTSVFNAAAVAVIVGLVICGASKGCSSCVALGIVYFAAWIILVTVDLSRDLISVALIFAVAGAAVLVAARFWFKKKVATHEAVPAQTP